MDPGWFQVEGPKIIGNFIVLACNFFLISSFPLFSAIAERFFFSVNGLSLDLEACKEERYKDSNLEKLARFWDLMFFYSESGRLPDERKKRSQKEKSLAKFMTSLRRKRSKHNHVTMYAIKLIRAAMWGPCLELKRCALMKWLKEGGQLPCLSSDEMMFLLDGVLGLGSPDNDITEKEKSKIQTLLYSRLLRSAINDQEPISCRDAVPVLEEAPGVTTDGAIGPSALHGSDDCVTDTATGVEWLGHFVFPGLEDEDDESYNTFLEGYVRTHWFP